VPADDGVNRVLPSSDTVIVPGSETSK